MLTGDWVRIRQISNRASHLQNAVVSPGTEIQVGHREFQQLQRCFIELAISFQFPAAHAGVTGDFRTIPEPLVLSLARFRERPKITCNARMGSRELKQHCELDNATLELLKFAMADLNLSARAYDRILKVARTIADLAGVEKIASDHVSEAIQYRSLDRQIWT